MSDSAPAVLQHKGYTWNWTRFHKWSDRTAPIAPELKLITRHSRVFGMGSCFADNVVRYLTRDMGVNASSFEESRFYDPVSMLQAVKHLLVEPQYGRDDMWTTEDGLYANPFRNPRFRAKSYEELDAWSTRIETSAAQKLKAADLIVMTLGGTESWRNPRTLKTYLTLPFPDVFNAQMPGIAEFHNLSFAECYAALEEIYLLLRRHCPEAHIVFTVSPVRLTFTVSEKDVTVATCQGKSTLRAAAGELTDKYRDHLHYFQSYEIVEYGPADANLFGPDGAHVTDLAVALVMNQFAHQFLDAELRNSAAFELTSSMLRKHDFEHLAAVRPVDLRYPIIRLLRTLGLEQAALILYQRLRKR